MATHPGDPNNVVLDIAGMYFSIEMDFVADESIKDLMVRVQAETSAAGYPAHLPQIRFTDELGTTDAFLDSVTVIHRGGSAKSRQNVRAVVGGPIIGRRQYPDGIYHFSDDAVRLDPADALAPLKAADPNKAFVSAWQYYVYDRNGVENARIRPTGPQDPQREIVPYGRRSLADLVKPGQTIVWRAVTIFVRPTHCSLNEVGISTRRGENIA